VTQIVVNLLIFFFFNTKQKRYWAVTSIDYIQKRTFKRITVMIIFVWIISALVSVCPLFGWKDPDWDKRIQVYQLCLISQDVGYQVTNNIIAALKVHFVSNNSNSCKRVTFLQQRIDLVGDAMMTVFSSAHKGLSSAHISGLRACIQLMGG